jgi:hypothetical protein
MINSLNDILSRMGEWRSIDCGPGWHQLIVDCHEELKALDPDYRVLQVKEKFNGLRYYFDTKSDNKKAMLQIAAKYEARSHYIDMQTGAAKMTDVAERLMYAFHNMGTGSRDDLKIAADEITSLRERLREAQRESDTWYQRHVS